MPNKRKPRGRKAKTEPVFVRMNYTSPSDLVQCGPLIQVQWTIPSAMEQHITPDRRPAPVVGLALVDTGASLTCISELAAQQLQLRPIGQTRGYGASGAHVRNVYMARFHFSATRKDRSGQYVMSHDMRVSGIPELEVPFRRMGVQQEGQTLDVIALLGRDILSSMTLKYYGRGAHVVLEWDMNAYKKDRPPRSSTP